VTIIDFKIDWVILDRKTQLGFANGFENANIKLFKMLLLKNV
jgi:hypothetical protein